MRSSPAMGHREGQTLGLVGLSRTYDHRACREAHAEGYCAKACTGACRSCRGHEGVSHGLGEREGAEYRPRRRRGRIEVNGEKGGRRAHTIARTGSGRTVRLSGEAPKLDGVSGSNTYSSRHGGGSEAVALEWHRGSGAAHLLARRQRDEREGGWASSFGEILATWAW